jgi:hypothetical protein
MRRDMKGDQKCERELSRMPNTIPMLTPGMGNQCAAWQTPHTWFQEGGTHSSGKDQSELLAHSIDNIIVSDPSEIGIAAACNGGLDCSCGGARRTGSERGNSARCRCSGKEWCCHW